MITRIRDYLSCHSKQATAVLLVLSAVLVLLIALQPVEQENVQKRMKLSIAENYHSRMQTEAFRIHGQEEIQILLRWLRLLLRQQG